MKISFLKNNVYKFGTFFILIFCLFFMTGCTIPFISQPSNEPVTLNYHSIWESIGTYQETFNKFQEQNPLVSVNYRDNSQVIPSAYKEDLLNKLKNNTEVPDVIRIHISWLDEFKPYLQGEIFSVSDFDSKYYPGIINAVGEKVVNKDEYLVYGMPLYYDSLVLVYNKDHFEESGIRAIPLTWEQFFNASTLLTRKDAGGTIIRSGAAFGNKDIEFYSDVFGYLLSSTGLLFPEDLNSDSDTLRSVLRVLNRSTDWNPSFVNSGNAIASRTASMAILPMWRVNDILTSNKDLNLGIAPLPQADISNPIIWPTYFVEVVPKNSKNVRASWDLLRFMSSEESAQLIYSKQASIRRLPSLPPLVSLSTKIEIDPMLKELSTYVKSSNSPQFDGSAAILSDRAGNNKCIDSIKDPLSNGNSLALVSTLPIVKEFCALK